MKHYWTVECRSLEMNTWRLVYLLTSKAVTPAELLWAYIIAKNYLEYTRCFSVLHELR